MCGRGRFNLAAADVAGACGVGAPARLRGGEGDEAEPEEPDLRRDNFGPGMACFIVCHNPESGANAVRKAQWGLVRATDKGPVSSSSFFNMFNARADRLEQVHQRLLGRKHCVAVFNGFYEWKKSVDALSKKLERQPYYVHPEHKGPLCMAGLYDERVDPETGETLTTFSIITVDSSPKLAWLHDRMPAVLSTPEKISAWLSAKEWNDGLGRLLAPENEGLAWHPVSKAIGSTKFQGPECAAPVKLPKPERSVASFFAAKPAAKSAPLVKSEKPTPQEACAERPGLFTRARDESEGPVEAAGPEGAKKRATVPSGPGSKSPSPKKRPKGQAALTSFFAAKPT